MKTQSLLGLDGLADFGLRSGADMRPTLLRILTDLYVQKLSHTPEEERHYAELALRLLDGVDATTRVDVASRLASHLSPPPAVVQRLAGDVPEVAAAMRRQLPHDKPLPIGNASLPPAATSAGDGTGSEARAAATPDAIDAITAGELNELFFTANAIERRLILLNLEIVAPLAAQHTGVARDLLVGRRLEAAALAHNQDDFALGLVSALRIPHAQARRIAADDLGEPVVVACKALAVPRDVLYRILMFVNPAVGHSVERVHTLAALYDDLTPRAALGMIAIWQALQRPERAAARYQPVTSDGDVRARARAAPVVQRPSLPHAPGKAAAERA